MAFIFGAKGLPSSAAELERLRRQAYAMTPQGSPSNVGEGLTFLGRAIASRMMNNRISEGEKAIGEKNASTQRSLLDAFLSEQPPGDPYAPALGGASAPAPMAGTMANARTSDRNSVGGYAAAPSAPASGQFAELAPRIASDLSRDLGLQPHQAAAVVGNLGTETGGFKHMQELNPIVPGSRGGLGWAQWTGPRRRQFEAWSAANGLDPTSYEANYGFLKHELTATPEGKVLDSLRAAPDVASATSIFEKQFLRPGIPHSGSRQRYAQQALALLGDGAPPGGMAVDMVQPTAYAPEAAQQPAMAALDTMAQPQPVPMRPAPPPPAPAPAPMMPAPPPPAPAPMMPAINTAGMNYDPATGNIGPGASLNAGAKAMPQAMASMQAPMPMQEAPAPQAAPPPVQMAMGGGRGGADPGIRALLIDALSNPASDEQTRGIAQMLLQRQMAASAPVRPEYGFITAPDGTIIRTDKTSGAITPLGQYAAPNEGTKPTDDMREYDLARQQGFQGSFFDFQRQMKEAGRASNSVTLASETEFEKGLGKADAERFSTLSSDGTTAQADLARIGELRGLLGDSPGGFVTGLQQYASSLGIKLGDNVSSIEAATALINQLVPQQRPAGSGTMSDRDVSLFKESLPSLMNTPQGNELILDTMEAMSKYRLQQADIADAVMSKEITRTEGMKRLRSLPNPIDAFRTARKKIPDAASNVPSTGGMPPPPKVGEIIDGMQFKGGDPADRNSWVEIY